MDQHIDYYFETYKKDLISMIRDDIILVEDLMENDFVIQHLNEKTFIATMLRRVYDEAIRVAKEEIETKVAQVEKIKLNDCDYVRLLTSNTQEEFIEIMTSLFPSDLDCELKACCLEKLSETLDIIIPR